MQRTRSTTGSPFALTSSLESSSMRSSASHSHSHAYRQAMAAAPPAPAAPVSSNPNKTQECHICLEDLRTDLMACPCGHVYHDECITQALQVNEQCPSCRGYTTTRHLIRLFLEVPDTNANTSGSGSVETAADLIARGGQDPQVAALNERVSLLVDRLQWQKKQHDWVIQEMKRARQQTEQLLVDKQTLLQRVSSLDSSKNELLNKVAKYQIELSRQAEAARQMAVNQSIINYLNTCNDDALEDEIQNPRELVMALKKACNFRHDQYLKAVREKTKLKTMVQNLQQQMESGRGNGGPSGAFMQPNNQDRGVKSKMKSPMETKRPYTSTEYATPHPLELKKRRVTISPGNITLSHTGSSNAVPSPPTFAPRLDPSGFRSNAYTDVVRPLSSSSNTARGFNRSSHNPNQYGNYNLVPSHEPPVQPSDHAVCRRGYDETGKLTNYFIPKDTKRTAQSSRSSTHHAKPITSVFGGAPNRQGDRRNAAQAHAPSHSSSRLQSGDRAEYALTAWLHKD